MLATTTWKNAPVTMEYVLALLDVFIVLSFLWLPLVFAAYGIGRKRFGLRFLFIAVTIEAVALAWGIYSLRNRFG